jgi:hypothetical protein
VLDYILVLFAVVLLALGFIIQKIYQRGLQSTTEGSVLFSIVSALCSIVLLILLNGFSFDLSWYSAINSLLRALCGLLYTILGFGIMKEGKVAFLQDYVARKKKEELHHEQRSSTEPVR